MEILVTGRNGKLGGALVRAWEGEHLVHGLGRSDLDLTVPAELERKLEGRRFDALVNCAAMADLETCERNPEAAELVNAESPRVLARIARERGVPMVHYSTDYVLDGSEAGLKKEGAPVDPLNQYARTKLAGEEGVLGENPDAVVARVSWLFGTQPEGFVEEILRRARRGERLQGAGDKFSKPTSAAEVARMTMALLEGLDLKGLFHLTHGGEPESWWSIATKVVGMAHELGMLDSRREVERTSMREVARLQVSRPIHTAMEPARLTQEVDWRGPSWEEAARAGIESLLD